MKYNGQDVTKAIFNGVESSSFIINGEELISKQHTVIEGTDSAVNGGMESGTPPTGWDVYNTATLASSSTAHGGSKSLSVTSNAVSGRASQLRTTTVGKWYKFTSYVKKVVGGYAGAELRASNGAQLSSSKRFTDTNWNKAVVVGRATHTGTNAMFICDTYTTNANILADDVVFQELSTPSLFKTYNFKLSNIEVSCDISLSEGLSGGLVIALDSESDPKNFVLAYISFLATSYNITLVKCVGGAYSTLIAATNITYIAAKQIKLVKNGSTISLYYNGTQIGADVEVKDLEIINGTRHGMFFTDSSISLAKFKANGLDAQNVPIPLMKFVWGSDVHVGSSSWVSTELVDMFSKMNDFSDATFLILTGDTLDSGYSHTPELMSAQYSEYESASAEFTKTIYPFKGNHDTGVDAFLNHGVIENNGVKIIYFHADYVGLSGSPDFDNTADITPEELVWLETQLSTGTASHKILSCHWSIVSDNEANFKWPITDDHGRLSVLSLASTYGAKLYLNGHEHNGSLATGTAGVLTDINGPSATQYFCVCSVYDAKIVVDMYGSKLPFVYIKTVEVALV